MFFVLGLAAKDNFSESITYCVFLLTQYEKEPVSIKFGIMLREINVNRACLPYHRWIMHRCTFCVCWCVLCLHLCGMKTKDYRFMQTNYLLYAYRPQGKY